MNAAATTIELRDYIRDVPNFPKPGILFRDITPLLAHPPAFHQAIERLAVPYLGGGVDVIAAAESRGFIFAAPLAVRLGVGFVPIRKPGKLPFEKRSHSYALEYGTDTLEMHIDGIAAGQRVLVVDDLLATGGTIEACVRLVEGCGGRVVGCAFFIHLQALAGEQRLLTYPIHKVLTM
jgi:adenine phosphoribosyltransferase